MPHTVSSHQLQNGECPAHYHGRRRQRLGYHINSLVKIQRFSPEESALRERNQGRRRAGAGAPLKSSASKAKPIPSLPPQRVDASRKGKLWLSLPPERKQCNHNGSERVPPCQDVPTRLPPDRRAGGGKNLPRVSRYRVKRRRVLSTRPCKSSERGIRPEGPGSRRPSVPSLRRDRPWAPRRAPFGRGRCPAASGRDRPEGGEGTPGGRSNR